MLERYTGLKRLLAVNAIALKAVEAWHTVSGTLLTFKVKTPKELDSCVLTLTPKQSGTGDPSPDNIRPISGVTGDAVVVTGKNLVEDTYEGYNIGSNGKIQASSDNQISIARVKKDVEYSYRTNSSITYGFFTSKPEPGDITYNGSRSTGGYANFTAPIDGWVGFRSENGYSTPELVIGETLGGYVAPSVTTYPLTIPTPPGTVYGGEIDAVNGTLKVTHLLYDLGTPNWQKDTSGDNWAFYFKGTNYIADAKVVPDNYVTANFLCSCYKIVKAAGNTSYSNNNVMFQKPNSQIFIVDTNYTDKDAFKTAMSGVKLCYELATPVTYSITPQDIETLSGVNHVWAEDGEITVKYWGF